MVNICVAQFVGFTVEVTCKVCGDKIAINNATPERSMTKMIRRFREEHETAHGEAK